MVKCGKDAVTACLTSAYSHIVYWNLQYEYIPNSIYGHRTLLNIEQQSQKIFSDAELLLLVCYTTELPKFQTAASCVNYTV